MSNLLNKILGNIATRIMFIIYITIILLTVFFILFGYYNQLNLHEQRQYDRLKGIVSSVAINIDGDTHQQLMQKYTSAATINEPADDSLYEQINNVLFKAARVNDLKSAMYTLVYDTSQNTFEYGVRSDDFIDFKNNYLRYPQVLKEKMNVGGTIPMYETENGIWLSAFHPIKNSEGKTVALLEADVDFTTFKTAVNREYLQQAMIVVVFVLVITLILLPYTRKILREDDHKKQRFLHQKMMIEASHREIKDSINYAQRIQAAIMPSTNKIKSHLPNSFIYYQPKDVVAGDFYWLEHIPATAQSDELILVASCDCTGHGVPGAMVSVICNNALNRAVREFNQTDPGKILDLARTIVVQEFEKSDDVVSDGMDISLAAIEYSKTNQAVRLRWAGANNPLWILRNEGDEVTAITPDKQPVGQYFKMTNFTTHELQLETNDIIYLFTDGLQDQFGGYEASDRENGGKKFKPTRLRELIVSIREQPMSAQKESIVKAFNQWKGSLEQVDDICIIGIRVASGMEE